MRPTRRSRRAAVLCTAVLTAGGGLAATAPAASAACTGATRTVAAQGASKAEAAVRCLVNERRAAAGLRPLAASAKAALAAQRHTDDMVRRRYFDHTSPGGSTIGDRATEAGLRFSMLGENIAVGQSTPAAVMRSWMASPGHRANILRPEFRVLGVGVHRKGTRGFSGPTWTQVFARPR